MLYQKMVNQLYQYINPFGGKHEKEEEAELEDN
jgi:hypothetical protein